MNADAGAARRPASASPRGAPATTRAARPAGRADAGVEARAARGVPADLDEAVIAAQAGSDAGYNYLYEMINPRLLRYLRAFVADEAEDVAMETWSQVCRDLHRFHGDGDGFSGWISTIGRNRALDHLRAQGRRPTDYVAPETLHDLAGSHDTANQAIESTSTAEAVAMIASLPPDQAEAVLLRVVMGLDAKAAGRVLGKRPGAVRTSAYRGLKTLAARLESDQL